MRETREEVGHPGEVARLLYIFRHLNTESLGIRELVELSNRTAGFGYRYPNPLPALRFAIELGLIQMKGTSARLTRRGKLFSERFAASPLDLNMEQGKLILGVLLDKSEFRRRTEALLSKFSKRSGSNPALQASGTLVGGNSEERRVAVFLQQVGALEYRDGVFVVHPDFEELLPIELVKLAKIDENALWERLEAQRLRARAAEEFVVKYERARLTELGRADLAELVMRISAVDVSAGYDIGSFEVDGSPRYVEVKSSIGSRVRFEWSVNERAIATQAARLYWIYFVPLAQMIPNLLEPIVQICNPIAAIASGRLVEMPSSFVVEAGTREAGSTSFDLQRLKVR